MEMKLIGHVGVDSGQLLLCDPCYIDSEWKQEDFDDIRKYKHVTTGDILEYRKDFLRYDEVIGKYGKTMNSLISSNEWEELQSHDVINPFSYNACAKVTLSEEGHGQLNYNAGHPGVGVAFTTQIGDGYYPVYAIYNDNGDLLKVEVLFQSDDDDDDDDDEN
jgi:hypothetical protein